MLPWGNSIGWVIIVLIVLFVMTEALGYTSFVSSKSKRESIEEAKRLARQVCRSQQWVQKIIVYPPPGMLVMELRSSEAEADVSCLIFPRNHPDFAKLESLSSFDLIDFEFSEEVSGKVTKHDAVAYLRLFQE